MTRSSAVTDGTLRELSLIVDAADSAKDGWEGVIGWVSARSAVAIAQIPIIDVEEESENLANQLAAALSNRPIPENTSFLYFGLFELAETCGFYVSGGERAPENPNALTEGSLTHAERIYLRSELLNELLRKSKEVPELNSWFSYALIWGAAGILAKYSAQRLGLRQHLLVGFDSGDVERVKSSKTRLRI